MDECKCDPAKLAQALARESILCPNWGIGIARENRRVLLLIKDHQCYKYKPSGAPEVLRYSTDSLAFLKSS